MEQSRAEGTEGLRADQGRRFRTGRVDGKRKRGRKPGGKWERSGG